MSISKTIISRGWGTLGTRRLLGAALSVRGASSTPAKTSQASLERKPEKDSPVKFTTSQANVDYKAVRNFYGDDRDLPPSHNIMLTTTGILGIFYLIYLRDDVDEEGGLGILRPVHESVPEIAIPMLQTAIAENRKFGRDTSKLEKRLAELMLEPEKYGYDTRKLVEN